MNIIAQLVSALPATQPSANSSTSNSGADSVSQAGFQSLFTETIARNSGHTDRATASQDQKPQASETKKSTSSQTKTVASDAAPVATPASTAPLAIPQTPATIALSQPAWSLPVSTAVPVQAEGNNSTVAALTIPSDVSIQTSTSETPRAAGNSTLSTLVGTSVASKSGLVDTSAQLSPASRVNPVVAGSAYSDSSGIDAASGQPNSTSIKAVVSKVELPETATSQPLPVQQVSTSVQVSQPNVVVAPIEAAPSMVLPIDGSVQATSTSVPVNTNSLKTVSDNSLPSQTGPAANVKTAVSDKLSSIKASLDRGVALPTVSTSAPVTTSATSTAAAKSQTLAVPSGTVEVTVSHQVTQIVNAAPQSTPAKSVVPSLNQVEPVISSNDSTRANQTPSIAAPVNMPVTNTPVAVADKSNATPAQPITAAQAAIAAPAAVQPGMNVPVSTPSMVAGSDVQSVSASLPATSRFSNSIGRDSVTNQGASSTKTKATSSDSKTAKSASAEQDDETSDSSTNSSFVVKATDAVPTQNQGTHDSKAPVEATALQQAVQAAPTAVATKDQPPTQNVAAPATDQSAVRAGSTSVPTDATATPGISNAQLVQSMSHSEMRLGMQSAEFGNISISTALNHQALSAQISVEHTELGRALAAHLSGIEEKLGGAYGVQAKVEVRDGGTGSSASTYSNSGQQQREGRSSQGGNSTLAQGGTSALVNAPTSSIAASVPVTTSRLDVRI